MPLVLSACSGSKGVLNDYRQARLDKPLEIPSPYNNAKIVDYYAIPPVSVGLIDELAEVPLPPALSLSNGENLVKIQSLFKDRWILVSLVPGQVWPLVSQFAVQQGMGVERELASEGVIETSWLLKTDDETRREKYRFKIDQGVQRRSTEITVLQFETDRYDSSGTVDWSVKAVDETSVENTLEGLARFLADNADPSAAVSLRAQNVDTQARLYLNVENEPTIFLKVKADRGFAAIAYALEKSGFTVNDSNKAEGTFYAQAEAEVDTRSATKRLLSSLAFYSKDKKKNNGEFVFTVKPNTDGWLRLTVEAEKGLDKADKKLVLKEVKRNLT